MVETMQNINLGLSNKKQITIDGDETRVIEIDTTDINILSRLNEYYTKIANVAASLSEFKPKEDNLEELAELIDNVDKQIRDYIDTIFDYPVSEVCLPKGHMCNPHKGQLAYEIIIESLIQLYDADIIDEANKIEARVKKHTQKYVKKN